MNTYKPSKLIEYQNKKRYGIICFVCFAVLIFVLALISLSVGSSDMTLNDFFNAIAKTGPENYINIVWNIRLPRILMAIIAGAGLSLSGLIMQTTLNNPMASPATLGVSNAAVFGANLSILALSQSTVTLTSITLSNPFATSLTAFAFSIISILIILGLCVKKAYSPGTVVLAGIALGTMWTAATTILQYYATDVGLSAAVIWNFGDLGRATYDADLIVFIIVAAGIIFFIFMSWKYNAMLAGDMTAQSLGVNVGRLRIVSLIFTSVIIAVCVSFLGVIGFVGIICPHITKKIAGHDHRLTIPLSALCGSSLLLIADTLSRCICGGSALPVGAITSLIGAPFFIILIISGKDNQHALH